MNTKVAAQNENRKCLYYNYDWILIYTEIVEESGKFKFTMSLHVEMVIFAINQSEMTEIVYQKVCFSI